jgi:TP901 family phage tail tape measure protein
VSEVHRASASLQQLQRELLASNRAISSSTKLANNLFRDTLTGSGQYSSHFVNLNSDVDKFGKNLDSGRLKLKNYFSTFREHATTQKGMIRELAKEQVMLQNSVLQPLGRNAQGLMQYNVMIPRGLDAVANSGKLARMEMQIMNRALSEGAGSLINWGKNTQWAGRQLTVGLTVPLTMFGAAAGKAFKEADQELVRLTKVYGGLAATSATDLKAIREEVIETAKVLSKTMGASFKDTIALGADIAATGQTGNELLGSISETTRLAILGEVDRQDAMKATLSIQTAFKQNTKELTESINFLNAVENQTSTTLNDLVEAIPKAGPVIQQLGGDVKDLALYLTAMREGGISASEGANALKSGLASLINPTKQTVGMMSDFGIDVMGMVAKNTGDTTGLLMDLQKALDSLDPLSKARAMEQMFGKFQFARMSALLNNLGKQGSQTLQVLDLMKASTAELADVASRELKMVTESASGKYKRAIEGLKAELADVGEEFLGVATKLINAASKILDFFTKLPDPIKKGLTFLAGFTALVGPLIMLTGLLANFFGYITKGVVQLRAFFMKANGWKMLTPEIIAAQKAAELVENAFYSDAAAAQVLHNALQKLVLDYQNLQAASAKNAIPINGGVSTVAGNPVMLAGRRVVDPSDPYVGDPNTRAMSHINPRDPNRPATIFGGVPGAIPVNRGISRTPQMYMHDRLPNIEGLTSVKGISTGIVPGEAAKFHALMATLGMQTEQEVAALKKTIMMGGTVSRELLDTFDDILPITQRFADSAATQSAAIVQQMRNAEITVEQAKARILALNAQIEADMGSAVGLYAAGRGRTLDLTRAPMMDQPVVDANGQFTLRDLYKKKTNAAVMTEFGRLRGIRTFGAPYSMQTTRMPRFNSGGEVESFSSNKTVVSGPSSIGYDDRLGSVPLGGYVLNQQAAMDPANAALVAMAPSTYLNNGGNITAALTPREVVFGPQIQKMPELYAAVDAANSGYNFGGQIMKGTYGYGRESTLSIWARLVNSKDYPKVIKAATVASDAAILSQLTGMDIKDATRRTYADYEAATKHARKASKANGTTKTEEFVKARTAQLINLSKQYPNANLILDAYSNKNKYDQNAKASGHKNIDTASYSNAMKSVVKDLVSKGILTSAQANKVFGILGGVTDGYDPIHKSHFITAKESASVFKPGELERLLVSNGMSKADAAKYASITGVRSNNYIGHSTGLMGSFNTMGNWLQGRTGGAFRDQVSPFQDEAKSNFIRGMKKLKSELGIKGKTTMPEIIKQLTLMKMKKSYGMNFKMIPTLGGRLGQVHWMKQLTGPMVGFFNKGGVIPGGSISADRSSYGVVPPLSARLEAIRLAQQAQYAKKREADMIKYPWIKEAVEGRDRGSSISPLLKLLAPGKQLDILEQAREMSKATATGSFKDLPPVKYGHMVAPSSGMSYPIPGVSGLYKDSEGRLKFFKGVPNEISAKAEVYGTRMAREVFGLDAPEQTIKTISNPLDPSGKSKLLGVESPFDKRFTTGGTVFNEDEMIRQTIASLVMNNKDLSPSNVFGNVLADVGAAGVFSKASRNTEHAKSLPSMIDQAMINLLGVKGGARKDFAVNTAPIAAGMTAKQYNRKMKAAMKKMHPKLVKFVAGLPREDRAPYIKLLKRFETGMDDATDFGPLHAVHVAAKRNSGGPVGGSIQRGRYSYGKTGARRPGNPAARAAWEAEQRAQRERDAEATRSRASSHQVYGQQALTSGLGREAARTGTTSFYNPGSLIFPQIGAQIKTGLSSVSNAVLKGTIRMNLELLAATNRFGNAYRKSSDLLMNSTKAISAKIISNATSSALKIKSTGSRFYNAIVREQNAFAARNYPAGHAVPSQGFFGPGFIGKYKDLGDGLQSRKVGSLGFRKTEYLVDGVNMTAKQAKAAGVAVPTRANGMSVGAQMGIGMAGSMAGMQLMGKEKVTILGKEMSGMTAGMSVMAATSILPMLPLGRAFKAVKASAIESKLAVKGFSLSAKGLSSGIAWVGRFAKFLGPIGLIITGLTTIFDIYKKIQNDQQDSKMANSITAKGAEEAGIKYFNLQESMQGYLDKQEAVAIAAKASRFNSIGMPGLPKSVEDMKKVKEEGKALKEVIESLNRSKSIEETRILMANQKAQYIAGGMSVEEANRKLYGALLNSEKAFQAMSILGDGAFGKIVDRATAAEFAVGNLINTINSGPGATDDWVGDINAGFEGLINTFSAATDGLIGTKDKFGNVIDEYKAYEMVMSSSEKMYPQFNEAIGYEVLADITSANKLLGSLLNREDSIKGVIAKWTLFTKGFTQDLNKIDSDLAIKLAGFTEALGTSITKLTDSKDSSTTFGSVGSVLEKLKKSMASVSAATQRSAAAAQRSVQEELKLIAKKIKLIDDEKNKKLEALRATQDASNYALELQKLEIEYQDALSRGDMAAANRAQLDIEQLTRNRQSQLTQQAIEDAANKQKAPLEKDAAAIQEKADRDAAALEIARDNAASSSEIAAKITDFQGEYNNLVERGITATFLPDPERKAEEAAVQAALLNLVKEIQTSGTGNTALAKSIREAFQKLSLFDKNGNPIPTVTTPPKTTGYPVIGADGKVVTPAGTINLDILKQFNKDMKSVSGMAQEITGGTSLDRLRIEMKTALGLLNTNKKQLSFDSDTNKTQIFDGSGLTVQKSPTGNSYYINKQDFVKQGLAFLPETILSINGERWVTKQTLQGKVYVYKMADGGKISGPGTGTSDSIPAMLSHGEYVVKASSVAKYGVRTLDAINSQKFHKGGPVHPHLPDGTHAPSQISLGDNRTISVLPTGTVWRSKDSGMYGSKKAVIAPPWFTINPDEVRDNAMFLTPPTKNYGIDKIKSPMGSLQRFLDIAKSQIGAGHDYRLHTKDNPTGAAGDSPGYDAGLSQVNKFTLWGRKKFGLNSDSSWWCGEFVAWVAEQAGVEISNKMQSAWQATQQYKKKGLFNDLTKKDNFKNLKVGDLAWFDYDRENERRDGVPDHASIVSRVIKDAISVIGWFGDDAVLQKTYSKGSLQDFFGSVSPEFKKPATKIITDPAPLSPATNTNQSSDTSTALSPTPTPTPTGFARGGLAALPHLKKKIFESFPKKPYPTRNPGGMGIDKSTPPLVGSGASAYFGGLLGGGGGMMVGYHDGGPVHPHPHNSLPHLKKKIFESFPKKPYPTRNPGGMGIDKSTPPLVGSGASAYFGGLLGGGGGMMVGYHDGGYVGHKHPEDGVPGISPDGKLSTMLSAAESMIGYKEGSEDNDTFFGKWQNDKDKNINSRFIAWCGAFMNWVANASGVPLDNMVYTAGGANKFKEKGDYHTENPQVGDMAFFNYQYDNDQKGQNRIQHIGLVRKILSDSMLETIEGNTSEVEPPLVFPKDYVDEGYYDKDKLNRIKDGVFRRNRLYNHPGASIVGFGRPKYKGESTMLGQLVVDGKIPSLVNPNIDKHSLSAATLNRYKGYKDGGVVDSNNSPFLFNAETHKINNPLIRENYKLEAEGKLRPYTPVDLPDRSAITEEEIKLLLKGKTLPGTWQDYEKLSLIQMRQDGLRDIEFIRKNLKKATASKLPYYNMSPAVGRAAKQLAQGGRSEEFIRHVLGINDLSIPVPGSQKVAKPGQAPQSPNVSAEGEKVKKFGLGGWVKSNIIKSPRFAASGATWQGIEEIEKALSLKWGANENASGFSKWSRALGRVAFNTLQGTASGAAQAGGVGLLPGLAAGLFEGLYGIAKDGSQYGVKGGTASGVKGFNAKEQLAGMNLKNSGMNIVKTAGMSSVAGPVLESLVGKAASLAKPWAKIGLVKADQAIERAKNTIPLLKGFNPFGGINLRDAGMQSAMQTSPIPIFDNNLLFPNFTNRLITEGILPPTPSQSYYEGVIRDLNKASLAKGPMERNADGLPSNPLIVTATGKDKVYINTPNQLSVQDYLQNNLSQVPETLLSALKRTIIKKKKPSGPQGSTFAGSRDSDLNPDDIFSTLGSSALSKSNYLLNNKRFKINQHPLKLWMAYQRNQAAKYWQTQGDVGPFEQRGSVFMPDIKVRPKPDGTIGKWHGADDTTLLHELGHRDLDLFGSYNQIQQSLTPMGSQSSTHEIYADAFMHNAIKTLKGSGLSAYENMISRIDQGLGYNLQFPSSGVGSAGFRKALGQNLTRLIHIGLTSRPYQVNSNWMTTHSKLLRRETWFGDEGTNQADMYGIIGRLFKANGIDDYRADDYSEKLIAFAKKYRLKLNTVPGSNIKAQSPHQMLLSMYPEIPAGIQVGKGMGLATLGNNSFNSNGNANGGYANIPKFENGINMVPANMLAMLHKNEAVVPANMNPFNPNASAAVSGSVYNISVELNGTNVTAQDVATQIHKEMKLKEMASGVNRRVGSK